MKESVGGFSLFNIVIVFVLLFTGYISISINYSKAYNIKNEIINIIKNEGGVYPTSNFQDQITDYFREANYRSTGNCEDGWYGYDRNGNFIDSGNNASFCVKGIKTLGNSELPNALYYQVKVFYQLDLPVISRIFNFSINGETSRIYSPNECTMEAYKYNNWCD